MPVILVNDVPQEIESTPATWGDLLDRLDTQAVQDGVVLSVARFDGVEEPAFREPALAGRVLSDIARIEIETAKPDAFLRQCLCDSIQPLKDAAYTALDLAVLYRQYDVSAGHTRLVELASELRALAILAGMLDGRLGIDVAEAEPDGVTTAQHLQALDAVLQSLVAAQESEDWLTIADILEYDLEPIIRRWAALLMALTSSM